MVITILFTVCKNALGQKSLVLARRGLNNKGRSIKRAYLKLKSWYENSGKATTGYKMSIVGIWGLTVDAGVANGHLRRTCYSYLVIVIKY